MRIKGATTVLNKQCEFLGMNFDQLIEFIERAPLAQTDTTIRAYKVYKLWARREENL
ncbi:hypothetical protein OAE42_06415 [Gammaproteobacteria bacterium]|nr:hypothetical protein [Gammaproteobacteria bacterium]